MGMPSAKRVWLPADLADLPDDGNRYEVIDGELHVTPAPTWSHQRAIARLYLLLAPYVEAQRLGEVLFARADLIFSESRVVQPDLFVAPFVDGKRAESSREIEQFSLVVEVFSPSTRQRDLTKRRLYREERVTEYWIVDPDARAFQRSTLAEEKPEVIRERLTWQPEGAAEPLVIDVAQYFRDVLDA